MLMDDARLLAVEWTRMTPMDLSAMDTSHSTRDGGYARMLPRAQEDRMMLMNLVNTHIALNSGETVRLAQKRASRIDSRLRSGT